MDEFVNRLRKAVTDGRPLVMDGGLSTELETHGHVLSDSLWTARQLLDHPGDVAAAHRAFADAGATVLITASYQVSEAGFVAAGLTARDARAALRASVDVARSAATASAANNNRFPPLVAASVGPYGAILADGSEYRGRYGLSIDDLAAFHRDRLVVLLEADPDLIAVETIPDGDEATALGMVLEELLDPVGAPSAWVSFSCASGGRLHDGTDIADAVVSVLRSDRVVAVGVNCTAPGDVAVALRRIRSVSDLPLVVYPNLGQVWDGEINEWCGVADRLDPEPVAEWMDLGVGLIGGCCGCDAGVLADLAAQIADSDPSRSGQEADPGESQ